MGSAGVRICSNDVNSTHLCRDGTAIVAEAVLGSRAGILTYAARTERLLPGKVHLATADFQ